MININKYISEKLHLTKDINSDEMPSKIGDILNLNLKYEYIVEDWVNKFNIKSFKIYARTGWRRNEANINRLKENGYTSDKIIHDYEFTTNFLLKTAHAGTIYNKKWIELFKDSNIIIRYFEGEEKTLSIVDKKIKNGKEIQFLIFGK